MHKPPWPNGQGVGLLIRRLRARVPQGVPGRNLPVPSYGPASLVRQLPCASTTRRLGRCVPAMTTLLFCPAPQCFAATARMLRGRVKRAEALRGPRDQVVARWGITFSGSSQGPHHLVVGTSRRGRNYPGPAPGEVRRNMRSTPHKMGQRGGRMPKKL